MVSKELRFTSQGIEGQKLTIKTGQTYTFVTQRQGPRQVSIYSQATNQATAYAAAYNFIQAYQVDDNYLAQCKLTLESTSLDAQGQPLPEGLFHYIVLISNNIDDNFFLGFNNLTTFIDAEAEPVVVPGEPIATLSAEIQTGSIPCGNFKLLITTNKTEGTIYIEQPVGTDAAQIVLNGSPSYEIELSRPTTATTGIVKYFAGERTSRGSAEVLYNPPPVLSITSVSVEGSPFGAFATINTTTGIQIETSLNGTEWKGSKEHGGLLAGNFTAYARDQFGCQKTKTFVVTEDQVGGLTAPPFFEIPKHNSMHFVDRSQNNFLGHITEETPAKVVQDWIKTDTPRTQFKSSFPAHEVKVYGCGSEEVISVIQKSDNINRINIYAGNYTEKEGKLAVHFTAGNIYNQDGTAKEQGHILNGRLPLWYKEGVYLNIEGVGVTKIFKILYEENTAYALTQKDAAGTVTNKKITSIHSEHPYEVYEFDIPMNRSEGNYIVDIKFEAGEWWSEIQRVNEGLKNDYLKVRWWNDQLNDQLIYSTGLRPFRRMKWDRYFTYIGQNEREITQGDTTIRLVKSKSKAVYELDFRPTGMEIARGMVDGFNHANHIEIDGAVFICNSSAKPENFGPWYFVKTELALIGQTVESIEADLTQINTQFLRVNDDATGVAFLRV